jgi:hypothetical protein
MVVLISRWPRTSWAMWGGIPFMTASVVKILLKSCGAKCSGWPVVSVNPVAASTSWRRVRIPSMGMGSVRQADLALEQQRQRRVPDLLMVVVGDHEWEAAVGGADAADDRGQYVGEFRGDDQEPFLVGLGGGDLQQRNKFTGAGQPVSDQAVVRDLAQLLDAYSGHEQDLDGGRAPEGVGLLAGKVPARTGLGLLGPEVRRVPLEDRAPQR